jgi:hypothetical protein
MKSALLPLFSSRDPSDSFKHLHNAAIKRQAERIIRDYGYESPPRNSKESTGAAMTSMQTGLPYRSTSAATWPRSSTIANRLILPFPVSKAKPKKRRVPASR